MEYKWFLHIGLTLTCCLFTSLILLFSYYSILVGSFMFSKYIIISSSKVKKKLLSFSCVCLLHSSLSFLTVFSRIPELPNRAGRMSIITMCLIFRVKHPVLEHRGNGWVLFWGKKGNIGVLPGELHVHSDFNFKRLTASAAGRVNSSRFKEGRGMKWDQ